MSSINIKKAVKMVKPSPTNSSKTCLQTYCRTLEDKLKLAVSAMEIHEKKIRELERENTKLIIKTQSASTPTPTPTFTPITADVSMNSSTASNSPTANNVENLKEDFDASANESPYSEYNKTKEDMTAPFEETNFALLFGSKPMAFASHESPEKQLLQGTKQQNKTVVSSEILHKHAENSPTIATLPSHQDKRIMDAFEPLSVPRFSYMSSFGIILTSLYIISVLIFCGEFVVLPVTNKMISIVIDLFGFLFDINWMVNDTSSSIFEIDWMH